MRHFTKTLIAATAILGPVCFFYARPLSERPFKPVELPRQEEEAPPPPVDSLTLQELKRELTIALDPTVPDPEYAPPAVEPPEDTEDEKKKISFRYGAVETPTQGVVRLSGAKIGVDYHVDDRHTIGVESSQQFYDRQDARAWGRSGEDESAAEVKYKLKF